MGATAAAATAAAAAAAAAASAASSSPACQLPCCAPRPQRKWRFPHHHIAVHTEPPPNASPPTAVTRSARLHLGSREEYTHASMDFGLYSDLSERRQEGRTGRGTPTRREIREPRERGLDASGRDGTFTRDLRVKQ